MFFEWGAMLEEVGHGIRDRCEARRVIGHSIKSLSQALYGGIGGQPVLTLQPWHQGAEFFAEPIWMAVESLIDGLDEVGDRAGVIA